MKCVRTLACTGLALLAFSASTLAQDEERRGGHHRGNKLARMQEHLQLSDDQMAQIQQIRENGGSREDMHAILTEDQLAQLEEHRARRGERRKGQSPEE